MQKGDQITVSKHGYGVVVKEVTETGFLGSFTDAWGRPCEEAYTADEVTAINGVATAKTAPVEEVEPAAGISAPIVVEKAPEEETPQT